MQGSPMGCMRGLDCSFICRRKRDTPWELVERWKGLLASCPTTALSHHCTAPPRAPPLQARLSRMRPESLAWALALSRRSPWGPRMSGMRFFEAASPDRLEFPGLIRCLALHCTTQYCTSFACSAMLTDGSAKCWGFSGTTNLASTSKLTCQSYAFCIDTSCVVRPWLSEWTVRKDR